MKLKFLLKEVFATKYTPLTTTKTVREAAGKSLKEYSSNRFAVETLKPMQPGTFENLMPKTAKTTKQAMARIKSFKGGTMFTHIQYFEVQPKGNTPNRPIYRIHQQQYWLNEPNLRMMGKDPAEKVNVTRLTIYDITPVQVGAAETNLGQVYVDTKVFLEECDVVFNILKTES